jgi:glutamine synthetase
METAQDILKKVSQHLTRDTFFVPIIGFELEFYLQGAYDQGVIKALESKVGYEFEEERGDGQFEIKTDYSFDIVALCDHLEDVKRSLSEAASEYGLEVLFDALPYQQQPGSGLHVHINLYDPKQRYYPFCKLSQDEESGWMLYAINGLLEHMAESMCYFAPDEGSMRRYISGKEAPHTISWGGNNRTVALRLPTTTTEPQRRRIEHRVPCASASPHFVVSAIIEGVRRGILSRKKPDLDKIYGDASQEQYHMVPLFKAESAII